MHFPVMADTFVELGFPEWGRIFLDATFGLGGHTKALLNKNTNIVQVIAIDRDQEALEKSVEEINDPRIIRVCSLASAMKSILEQLNINSVDGILFDLGVSSLQLDSPERGFSFSREGPLDMRMNNNLGKTAAEIVNEASESELVECFQSYGEEKFAKRIASAIVKRRKQKKITLTTELAEIVKNAVPAASVAKSRINPATRVFQALRIMVNDELNELKKGLAAAVECLSPGGKLSVISFHSLEDRIVKSFFNTEAANCICPPGLPKCVCNHKPRLKILTKKPLTPKISEIKLNPRCRSAKLRISERLP